ncbi:unnamed protein product [Rotaria sp. Silwood1]|nr:unnamed protein product [Rotaria sp. Silwood1]
METIRLQLIIDMETNPLMSDCYFKIPFIWLTSDSTINYLTQKLLPMSNENNIDEKIFNLFCYISSRAVYYKTSCSSLMCVSRKTTPKFFQLTNTTERLLQAFIIYLNSYLLDDCQHSANDTLILKWLLYMADIYGFIPYFVKTETWLLIINILCNFARHRIGINALNKLKTLEILKEWKNQYFSELPSTDMMKTFEEILVAYYLLYVILLEPKEMKKGNMTCIQNVLDHIIERTIQAFNSSEFNCDLYNVTEYLAGLAKLVAHDKFLRCIISKDNIFDLFFGKFLEFNHLCTRTGDVESNDLHGLICVSLYTIFWSISFQSDYYVILKNNNEFIRFVVEMSKTESNDDHIIAMRRAAKGILLNLDLVEIDLQPIDKTETDYDNVQVMISYAHKDTKLCQKLVSQLQNRIRGDIWVDFIKLKPPYDDDWEDIARAITQCDGKEYQLEDWFEIRVGSATFVRFGDNKNDENMMETLLNLIHATDKISNPIIENLSTQSVSDSPIPNIVPNLSLQSVNTKPIEQWTNVDVQHSLQLPPSILDLSSGQALLAYIRLLSNEDALYDEYETCMRHRGLSREQFANLIESLKSLRSLYNIEAISTIPSDLMDIRENQMLVSSESFIRLSI